MNIDVFKEKVEKVDLTNPCRPLIRANFERLCMLDPSYEPPEVCIDAYYDLSSAKSITVTDKNYPLNDVRVISESNPFTEKENEFINFKYIEDMDMLSIAFYSIDDSTVQPGDIRLFSLIDFMFVDKEINLYYKHNGQWKKENDIKVFKKEYKYSLCLPSLLQDRSCTAIAKTFGVRKINNKYYEINGNNAFRSMLLSSDEKRTGITKKIKKLADDVLKLSLDNTIIDKLIATKKFNHSGSKISVFENINENASVIRWFWCVGKDIFCEYMRFYATDDGCVLCDIDAAGKFQPLVKNIPKEYMTTYAGSIRSLEDLKKGKFKYFAEMIMSYDDSCCAQNTYELFRFELLEKMSKTGLDELVKKSLNSYRYSRLLPYTTIGQIFSVKISPNATDIYKALGVNKFQYKMFIDHYKKSSCVRNYYYNDNNDFIFKSVRTLLTGTKNGALNDIDNKTFEDAFDAFVKIKNDSNYWNIKDFDQTILLMREMYVPQTCLSSLVSFSKIGKDYNALGLYKDFIRIVHMLDNPKAFPIKFISTKSSDLKEELKEKHDAASAIYDLKKSEVDKARFKKSVEKCDKWKYSSETFSAIAPVLPEELAREGLELHHCVKSYIERVASERTNIMFIRKSSDLEKPFFTVEVSNDGYIEQVHGFGNRNANTEPGLEDFVEEWAKATKLKLHGFNKIR